MDEKIFFEKCVLELCRTVMIKPNALVFFYWTTTDKLEFTGWSEVQQRFGSGEKKEMHDFNLSCNWEGCFRGLSGSKNDVSLKT